MICVFLNKFYRPVRPPGGCCYGVLDLCSHCALSVQRRPEQNQAAAQRTGAAPASRSARGQTSRQECTVSIASPEPLGSLLRFSAGKLPVARKSWRLSGKSADAGILGEVRAERAPSGIGDVLSSRMSVPGGIARCRRADAALVADNPLPPSTCWDATDPKRKDPIKKYFQQILAKRC